MENMVKEVKNSVQARWNGWIKSVRRDVVIRVSAQMKGKVYKMVVRPGEKTGDRVRGSED